MTSKLTRKNGEGTNVAIRRRIDNLKNTHAGAHRRVPLQPYIRGMVHTSELRCMDHPYIAGSIVHTSEDGQYLSIHWSSDVQYAFQHIATFILLFSCNLHVKYSSLFHTFVSHSSMWCLTLVRVVHSTEQIWLTDPLDLKLPCHPNIFCHNFYVFKFPANVWS